MLISFGKQKLTIGELKSGKISENILSEGEYKIAQIIMDWLNGQDQFTIRTSGSTGTPSQIYLSREKLTYSATTSMNYLDPKGNFKSVLLCISPDHIGGLMVLVRALIYDLDLHIIPPSTHLSETLRYHTFNLASLVPMQVQQILKQEANLLERLNVVLVGGAPLLPDDEHQLAQLKNVKVYHTYGMTETASHVALKNVSQGDDFYETLGDIIIDQDEQNRLKLKGTITDHKWLQTNDVVEIIHPSAFKWLGRADFVINSGGIKVHPEIIERMLSDQLEIPYFVAGIPDERLGEKVVLIVASGTVPNVDFASIEKYHRPKEILTLEQFSYTQNGKLDRPATLKKLNI